MKLVKSAYRALDLLEILSNSSEGLSFTEIMNDMQVARSTAHELLQTLVARKYIHYHSIAKKYILGSRVLSLGAHYMRHSPYIQKAYQIMGQLVEEFGEKVKIGVLSGSSLVMIKQEGGTTSPNAHDLDAIQLPCHATSMGKALLCNRTKDEVKALWEAAPFESFTPKSMSSWLELWREIQEVSAVGLAFEAEEHEKGIYSMAVPIMDEEGEVIAAVAMYMDSGKMSYNRLREAAFRMVELALQANEEGYVKKIDAGKKTIYFSIPNLSSQKSIEYLQVFEKECAHKEMGLLVTNCHDDEWKQQLYLEMCLVRQVPDSVVIVPVNAINSDVIFRMAAQHEIPALCFQRPSRSRYVDYYVGGDGFQQGVMQMQAVAERLNGRGKVLILEGDPYNDNARNIVLGNMHVLKQHPRMQLVLSIPVLFWSKEEAKGIIAEMLEKDFKFDAILTGTDHMAEGVIEELRKHKLNGKIFVVGGDGDESAVRLIKGREQYATVFQYPSDAARQAVRVAIAMANKEPLPSEMVKKGLMHDYPGKEVQALEVPFGLIDASNIAELENYWKMRG
ncbi:substrate-binding domain-containing protein [Paenibacillus alginolyticus]|uniref:Substrate-binding domain-containing protein n=1 Tax=Paenibacillus alginolyticus TaxID=59839 RepID=A0ABT4GGX7_9BACL|nr:substrate-binding domain-containing protein [Paenibacillus alginolyticus]MCY9695298.1 substrate-binding domain-containing protein [Paenibacillus alginolyticus]MEC0144810.1 substrate-binding domain-containing protein [Paenibacillus alginolyticus]